MIAAFPMYDRPELRADHAKFWELIRAELAFGPSELAHPTDLWAFWQSTDLVLGQTCGMPYRTKLHDIVSYVITPDYGLTGCPAGYYNSVLLANPNRNLKNVHDLDGRMIAYNEPVSQSGWAAPINHLADFGVRPASGIQTGAHLKSMETVASGKADFCAIDAQTYRLALRYTPQFAELTVINHTAPTPALPYICHPNFNAKTIAGAVENAFQNLDDDARSSLSIRGFVRLDPQRYLAVKNPARPDEMFN